MLLLLLLVTPLVNAGDDSWASKCNMCTLPGPLKAVTSTGCLTYAGTWYGLMSNVNQTCYYETFTETGSNQMGMALTQIRANGYSQTYYGSVKLHPNNLVTYSFPNGFPEGWNYIYQILATDCETYVIYGHCDPGSCKRVYEIEYSTKHPSSYTMKRVETDLNNLGLSLANFGYIC